MNAITHIEAEALAAIHHQPTEAPVTDPVTASDPSLTHASPAFISILEHDAAELAALVKAITTASLPAALDGPKRLAGNPVVAALLRAEHVPAEAWPIVVNVVDGLAAIYRRDVAEGNPNA